uniref:Transposase n=1 Tax=Desertifilum tharense IPPAS B-1220 TaxID=1781255 RepID=A0ACD5GZQ8_9CYAN
MARWDLGYKDPWLILTDLEPNQADALWYGLRASTECVYRDLKSDGWQWHNTRLLSPQRAERLWLALAVATLWMVILGGEAENQSTPQTINNCLTSISFFLSHSTQSRSVKFQVSFWA